MISEYTEDVRAHVPVRHRLLARRIGVGFVDAHVRHLLVLIVTTTLYKSHVERSPAH